jgi:hypothetical protein
MTVVPFNPLDKKNLGASVAEALLSKDIHPLAKVPKFNGAGIYAIYYVGDHTAYENLSRMNSDGKFLWPIYVGKAIPKGGRTGIASTEEVGNVLQVRLREHANSIKSSDLELDDFYCRFLVVDDIWIPLGESLIITRFVPVWNAVIDGFGNHQPGKGREAGVRPRWDTLHPGRRWAVKLPEREETADEIAREAKVYLSSVPACLSDHFIQAEGE